MNGFLMDIAAANEQINCLRYQADKELDRIKEIGEMYKSHGFFEIGLALLMVAEILKTERIR